MVGTRDVAVRRAEADAADLGSEQSRAHVARGEEPAEAANGTQCRAHQSAVDFRFAELRGKCERSIEQRVEIVCALSELPEILGRRRILRS